MSIERVGIRISGPLAGFAEGYGTELTLLGYAPASVRLQLKVLADLSDWLSSHGTAPADLRRSDLDRFLRHRRAAVVCERRELGIGNAHQIKVDAVDQSTRAARSDQVE